MAVVASVERSRSVGNERESCFTLQSTLCTFRLSSFKLITCVNITYSRIFLKSRTKTKEINAFKGCFQEYYLTFPKADSGKKITLVEHGHETLEWSWPGLPVSLRCFGLQAPLQLCVNSKTPFLIHQEEYTSEQRALS